MRLHVLAGAGPLLVSERIAGETLAALAGPQVRPATAFWIARRAGRHYHDFLLDDEGDARVEVFAQSLADNFGARFEPLIVLPELLSESEGPVAAAPGRRRPLDVLREIRRRLPGAATTLTALALPDGIDGEAGGGWAGRGGLLAPVLGGRLDGLRAHLAASDPEAVAVATRVIEVRPDRPGFDALWRNAVASAVADQAGPRLGEAGLAARGGDLAAAAARLLAGWAGAGVFPALPLRKADLDRLGDRLVDALLAGSPADG